MSYYLKHKDFTPKNEYKRISEFTDGLVKMKQNGFIYLIIRDTEKQWENTVNLSTGLIESRSEIEVGYDKHNLGFIKVNGVVELTQTPDIFKEIEKIIAKNIGWDKASEIASDICDSGLI